MSLSRAGAWLALAVPVVALSVALAGGPADADPDVPPAVPTAAPSAEPSPATVEPPPAASTSPTPEPSTAPPSAPPVPEQSAPVRVPAPAAPAPVPAARPVPHVLPLPPAARSVTPPGPSARASGHPRAAQPAATTGIVRGRVWHDRDGDGRPDGEPGLQGAVVALGAEGSSVEYRAFAIAGPDGRYEFARQRPGRYRVVVLAPGTGWVLTRPGRGSDVAPDATRRPVPGQTPGAEADETEAASGSSAPFDLSGGSTHTINAGFVSTGPDTAPGAGGALPLTGASALPALATGSALLLTGALLVLLTRRRTRTP